AVERKQRAGRARERTVVGAHRRAQESAVVIGDRGRVVVAAVALPRAHRRGVGDTVTFGVRVGGLAGVARAEKQRHDAGGGELVRMGEEVFGAVVLVVVVGVVHGVEVLVH